MKVFTSFDSNAVQAYEPSSISVFLKTCKQDIEAVRCFCSVRYVTNAAATNPLKPPKPCNEHKVAKKCTRTEKTCHQIVRTHHKTSASIFYKKSKHFRYIYHNIFLAIIMLQQCISKKSLSQRPT